MNINLDKARILIWGYGREGKSTEDFIRRRHVPQSVDIYEGGPEGINRENYDVIIKSPGIPIEPQICIEGREKEGKAIITSQTEIFLNAFRDRVIGITGTKGKSTTSAMLAKVLTECLDRKVLLLGNIGKPCLDSYEEMGETGIAVLELSCHQLSTCPVSPHIGVFLNIFEEHLDYYGTFSNYFRAKCNIGAFQKEEDYFYRGDSVDFVSRGHNITISYQEALNRNCYSLGIPGSHNQFNAEFVYRIATERFGCSKEAVLESMAGFGGLPHRLEFLGSRDGLSYYDDSISTIPEAAISAMRSIPEAATLLIGGMDRGIDYSPLVEFIQNNKRYNYIFMYASGERIYGNETIASLPNTYLTGDLYEAVELARRVTSHGAVILSPAAPSYGYFKDFNERGEVFRSLVKPGNCDIINHDILQAEIMQEKVME